MSVLAVNTITDVAGSLPPVFPAGSAQLNPLADREDKIINGDFGLWQRGASFTTLSYGADRWFNNLIGGTVTQSRQAFAIGDTLGDNSPTFFLRQTVSGQTLAGHVALTQQYVEGVRSYSGQTITVLGWARRSSGTGNMVVEAEQMFGTGGSPSASVANIPSTTITLTGSWAPFAAVIAVPSITGKTLGTAGNDRLQINFWTSAGSSWNARSNSLGLQTIGVDFWGIHIRAGTWTSAATADYRPRDPGTELALCQRYYETGSISDDGGLGVKYGLAGAAKFNASHPFQVTKRALSTIAFTGTVQYSNCSAISAAAGSTAYRGFTSRVTVTASGDYRAFDGNWTADAEL